LQHVYKSRNVVGMGDRNCLRVYEGFREMDQAQSRAGGKDIHRRHRENSIYTCMALMAGQALTRGFARRSDAFGEDRIFDLYIKHRSVRRLLKNMPEEVGNMSNAPFYKWLKALLSPVFKS